MKISKRIDDYKIYVEDDKQNFISTGYINEAQESLSKTIYCKICIKKKSKDTKDNEFAMNISADDLKILSNLLIEVVKHLET